MAGKPPEPQGAGLSTQTRDGTQTGDGEVDAESVRLIQVLRPAKDAEYANKIDIVSELSLYIHLLQTGGDVGAFIDQNAPTDDNLPSQGSAAGPSGLGLGLGLGSGQSAGEVGGVNFNHASTVVMEATRVYSKKVDYLRQQMDLALIDLASGNISKAKKLSKQRTKAIKANMKGETELADWRVATEAVRSGRESSERESSERKGKRKRKKSQRNEAETEGENDSEAADEREAARDGKDGDEESDTNTDSNDGDIHIDDLTGGLKSFFLPWGVWMEAQEKNGKSGLTQLYSKDGITPSLMAKYSLLQIQGEHVNEYLHHLRNTFTTSNSHTSNSSTSNFSAFNNAANASKKAQETLARIQAMAAAEQPRYSVRLEAKRRRHLITQPSPALLPPRIEGSETDLPNAPFRRNLLLRTPVSTDGQLRLPSLGNFFVHSSSMRTRGALLHYSDNQCPDSQCPDIQWRSKQQGPLTDMRQTLANVFSLTSRETELMGLPLYLDGRASVSPDFLTGLASGLPGRDNAFDPYEKGGAASLQRSTFEHSVNLLHAHSARFTDAGAGANSVGPGGSTAMLGQSGLNGCRLSSSHPPLEALPTAIGDGKEAGGPRGWEGIGGAGMGEGGGPRMGSRMGQPSRLRTRESARLDEHAVEMSDQPPRMIKSDRSKIDKRGGGLGCSREISLGHLTAEVIAAVYIKQMKTAGEEQGEGAGGGGADEDERESNMSNFFKIVSFLIQEPLNGFEGFMSLALPERDGLTECLWSCAEQEKWIKPRPLKRRKNEWGIEDVRSEFPLFPQVKMASDYLLEASESGLARYSTLQPYLKASLSDRNAGTGRRTEAGGGTFSEDDDNEGGGADDLLFGSLRGRPSVLVAGEGGDTDGDVEGGGEGKDGMEGGEFGTPGRGVEGLHGVSSDPSFGPLSVGPQSLMHNFGSNCAPGEYREGENHLSRLSRLSRLSGCFSMNPLSASYAHSASYALSGSLLESQIRTGNTLHEMHTRIILWRDRIDRWIAQSMALPPFSVPQYVEKVACQITNVANRKPSRFLTNGTGHRPPALADRTTTAGDQASDADGTPNESEGTADKNKVCVSLRDIVEQKTRSEVCRIFLTTLMLANRHDFEMEQIFDDDGRAPDIRVHLDQKLTADQIASSRFKFESE